MSKYVGFKMGKVHEESVISEYYCGGCGWPVTDHDSFCPECGGAFRESDADDSLQAENAKLREENERLKLFANGDAIITDYWKDEDGTMHVLTTDGSSTFEYMRGGLADENAKLRELCKELAEFLTETEWLQWPELRAEMQRLVVEADE